METLKITDIRLNTIANEFRYDFLQAINTHACKIGWKSEKIRFLTNDTQDSLEFTQVITKGSHESIHESIIQSLTFLKMTYSFQYEVISEGTKYQFLNISFKGGAK